MRAINSKEWRSILAEIDLKGFARIRDVLSEDECQGLTSEYSEHALYRSTIDMRRYRFGEGQYRYFTYPLPGIVQRIRAEFYPPLAELANRWNEKLSIDALYPMSHERFIDQCHDQKQLRPTPLILRYEKGGHNRLHQDLYGNVYFPLQVVFMLTQSGLDYSGGQLVMTEQVPRAQSRAIVIEADKGDGIVFTTNYKPVLGTRGYYRAVFRHGVSEVESGVRYAMGVIFHDAN